MTDLIEDGFREMARRLRELQVERDQLSTRAMDCEMSWTKERADRAESALLASQAREGELREELRSLLAQCRNAPHQGPCEGPFAYSIQRAEQTLSHSTGSKIMAVVEAAKKIRRRHVPLDKRESCDCIICLSVRALEDK